MADKFQLKALITGVDKLSPMLAGVRKNVAGFRKQLASSGLGDIGFSDLIQGGAFAAPFVAGTRAAINFESAMADVKKVVNFDSPAQFKQMSDDVLGLSEQLPMAADGIAAIVAAGGQAGLAREELKGFATDAVKMGIAFDQTADQSGEMMAKWRTGFRLTQAGVVQLADKINYLSNNGPANAQQIAQIVTAIGPLGEVAGLASGQIAAMGATLAGVGVKEDVAATGMKNFMLTLTAGAAATKQQQQAWQALRMDSKSLAVAMQKDAQGTIMRVLTAISKVDKAKQASLLSTLFGRESIGAIAPMLTNMELLRKSFNMVGDAEQYSGSMEQEYASRAATTANNLQLMQNRVTRLGISIGAALLPPLNDAIATLGPLISQVSAFSAANPAVVKGVLGAAAGFMALRLGVLVATTAMKVFSAVTAMSPIGLIVRGIALVAGVLIANWSTVAPFFSALWERIKGPAMTLWGWIKAAFAWTPLGLIIANWQPLAAFFSALWEDIKGPAMALWGWIKTAFAWTPLGLIIANWQPLTAFFSALWGVVRALAGTAFGYFKAVFAWTPLGLIIANWRPLTAFFSALWGVVKALAGMAFSYFKTVFAWTPLGLIIANWRPLTAFFSALWGVVKALAGTAFGYFKAVFAWTPLGLIIANWQPLTAFFGALWDVVKGLAGAAFGFFKEVFAWSPLGLVISNWEPLVAWFKGLWDRIQPYLEPIMNGARWARDAVGGMFGGDAEGGGMLKRATDGLNGYRAELTGMPAGPGDGSLLRAGALGGGDGSLLQQAAANNRTQLQGALVVRFDNAPPGLRTEPAKTNQPGLTVSPQVGYRSLAGGAG